MHANRRRVAAVLAAIGALGIAIPAAASAASLITISGATASYPLVSLLAQKYIKTYPGRARFKISQGGAQIGVNDVNAGRVSIGDVSRDPEPTDPPGLQFYPIAKYGICVVTNSKNPVSNLSESEVINIFTGKTKNWSEVSGAKASGTIDLISRTSVAGVLTNFQTLMLGGKKVVTSASQEASEGLLKQAVENDPSSIGFLSNYQADGSAGGKVHSVSFNGVACNKSTIKSNSYAGVAHFYEVTKGPAKGAAKQFISWIDSSKAAKKIIASQWVPLEGGK